MIFDGLYTFFCYCSLELLLLDSTSYFMLLLPYFFSALFILECLEKEKLYEFLEFTFCEKVWIFFYDFFEMILKKFLKRGIAFNFYIKGK